MMIDYRHRPTTRNFEKQKTKNKKQQTKIEIFNYACTNLCRKILNSCLQTK